MARFSDGRDEYGDGPVSNVASAVATASAALSNVPVIGPFARATEIGAGALSRVASWFGYTNVPVISDVQPFKELPFGGFASSEIGAPTPKLILDPKNELTLDSRTVGLDGTDELSLESFLSHESYLTSFDWDSTDAQDTVLWACANSPAQLYRRDSNLVWPTPLSHACSLYQFWTGSLIYRFKIVATAYHRGRIRIQFEPSNGTAPGGAGSETANITRVYDIGETQDIEICVPYMQSEAYSPCVTMSQGSTPVIFSSVGGFAGISGQNGSITISVTNVLTSPVANAPVSVAVFVRAGEDFKFMGPRTPPQLQEWIIQSETKLICDDMGDVDAEEPAVNLVYGGESALSLRQLLHRHCYTRSFVGNELEADYVSFFHMYPYSLKGTTSLKNIHPSGLDTFNYVANSFVSWLSPCFAGRRGSMYWAVNMALDRPTSKTIFFRETAGCLPTTADIDHSFSVENTNNSKKSFANLTNAGVVNTGNGAAVYNTGTQDGCTVLMPYISPMRFMGTFPSPFVDATTMRPGVPDTTIGFKYSSDGSALTPPHFTGEYYCATGPDFNLFFFVGIPSIRLLASIPIPS